MRASKYKCDICKKELFDFIASVDVFKQKMMVVFETEQQEGKKTKPYFDFVELDLCHKCNKLAKKKIIRAEGAMGYNTFWFY